MPGVLTQVSPHLWVFQDHINVGIVRDGERALLIDFGAGAVQEALRGAGVTAVEAILFTHHHRDQACGAHPAAEAGAAIIVPAGERQWFEDPASFWNDPRYRWHLYNSHPHHLMLVEPLPVSRVMSDGETLSWGQARITAMATPGHTDHSLSYLVEVDGQRVAFTGDLIYDSGRIWELYSLQKGNDLVTDYHGFLGARAELEASLRRVVDAGPGLLVPAHGRMMRDPAAAAEALFARLRECYDTYAAISALRWYFPDMFPGYMDGPGVMPIRRGFAPPACLRHVSTSWILVSRTGAAFVMDCGSDEVVAALKRLIAEGEVTSVDALWITHFHDDHVEAVPAFRKAFPCEIIADVSVTMILDRPLAWRLPCMSPSPQVDRWTREGDTWDWHEYTLTAFHFPGQSLYHGGLLADGPEGRMFFIGDSHTPAGIDDYCAQNRNFLGKGVGFQRCLDLIELLKPSHLFNPHVDVAFDYTDDEICYMRDNLTRREALFGALFPWDHPNFGMDESWAVCFPYEQRARPGEAAELALVVTNHASEPREARCRPVLPRAWGGAAVEETSHIVPAKGQARLAMTFRVPAGVASGRVVIPVDVTFGGRYLPQLAEAALVVCGEAAL